MAVTTSGHTGSAAVRVLVAAYRYGQAMNLETPAQIAVQVAYATGLTGDINTLDRAADEVSKVTAADLVEFAKTYLTPSNRTVVTLTSREKS